MTVGTSFLILVSKTQSSQCTQSAPSFLKGYLIGTHWMCSTSKALCSFMPFRVLWPLCFYTDLSPEIPDPVWNDGRGGFVFLQPS